MPETAETSIDIEVLVALFRDLEEWTVSLDRIGSRIAWGASPEILLDYVEEARLVRRIARRRGVIGDILDGVLGAEVVEEIAARVLAYGDSGWPEEA